MKLTECETPHVVNEDHERHVPGDVCWGVVRLYIAGFRRGLPARLICEGLGYIWNGTMLNRNGDETWKR